MSNRQLLGLAGCGSLALGVFLPIIRIGFGGSINYYLNGQGDGAIVLVVAGISLLAVLAGWFRLLIATGLIATAICLYDFLNLTNVVSQDSLTSAMIQADFGWVVLFLGCGLLLVAAFRQPASRPPEAI